MSTPGDGRDADLASSCVDEAVINGILRITSGSLNVEVQKRLLLQPCVFPSR